MGAWRDYWCLFLLWLLISLLTCKAEGPDSHICNYVEKGDGTFPTLPNKLEVRVQILHKYGTEESFTNINENIDIDKKQISIRVSEVNYEDRFYYFGQASEAIRTSVGNPGTPDEYPHVCEVTPFTWDSKGFITEITNGKRPHYMYSFAILFAGKDVAIKKESSKLDDINVDKWEACIYFKPTDTTVNATYYFTADSVETPYNKKSPIPLRIDITGAVNHTETLYTTSIKYMDVRYNYVQRWAFQLPAGTYCSNRSLPHDTSPFKKNPKYFKTNVEIVNNMMGFESVNYVKWWNDNENKIGRMDIRPVNPFAKPLERNQYLPLQKNIFDLNRNIRFVITDNDCKRLTVTEHSKTDDTLNFIFAFYEELNDAITNTSKPYKYQDQRQERGMRCNVFATEGTFLNLTETGDLVVTDVIEELLTSDVSVVINSGRSSENGVPLKYSIYNKKTESYMTYQFYDFDDEVEAVYSFDVSSCVEPKDIKYFTFFLNNDSIDKVRQDTRETGYSVHRSLAKAASISPLRISNLKVGFDNPAGLAEVYPVVTFALLGPSSGSNDKSLSEAEKDMKNNFKGTTTITVPDPLDFKNTFNVKFFESKGFYEYKITEGKTYVYIQPSGYSPGDMAGLAIGMIILGCLLALGLIFVFSMYDIAGFNDGLGSQLFHK